MQVRHAGSPRVFATNGNCPVSYSVEFLYFFTREEPIRLLGGLLTVDDMRMRMTSLRQILRLLGIDRAVLFTLLGRLWSVGAGLLTLFFVTRFLSPTLQGYYYTFYSLIALQIFAEMGLNFAILQFASHEMAGLSWMGGILSGSPESKQRLQSLVRFAGAWFSAAALVMVAVLLPVGIFFFGQVSSADASIPDVGPAWSLLVILTAANLFVGAALSILEGCGKVAEVAILRLWQSVFSVVAAWTVLTAGGHLYALVANSLMLLLVGLAWLCTRYRFFFKDLLSHQTALPGMNWRKEIWPFQWRIAISCMSGFLISQLFNPLLFATHGPIVAGQMGMSMQIIAAMNGVGMAWITTKVPTYGILIATRQTVVLDTLFFRGLIQSFVILLIGVICVIGVLSYLNLVESPYASRLLSLRLFSVLCISCLAQHVVLAEAAYLRAHKQEPFMVISVLSGSVTAALALVLIPTFGGAGAVYSYASTTLLIGLCGGTIIFMQKRKAWRVS